MPILTKQPFGYYKKTKLASEETGVAGVDGIDGVDGAGANLSEIAKVDFTGVTWADTMYFNDFTTPTVSGVSYNPSEFELIVGSGIALIDSIGAGTYYLYGTYDPDTMPTANVGVLTALPFSGSSGNSPPGEMISDTSQPFTGDVSDSYKCLITAEGDYGVATVSVIRVSDNTVIVNNEIITYDTYITVEKGVKIKWSEAGPANFSRWDVWNVRCETGNVASVIYRTETIKTATVASFQIQFLDDPAKYITLAAEDTQYSEGTTWVASTHSGTGIGWKLGITTNGSQSYLIKWVRTFMGDSQKFSYH